MADPANGGSSEGGPRTADLAAAYPRRKSGQPRTTPLLYTPHDEGFIIVASKAGAAHNPAWYYNLRAHPDAVTVELEGRRIAVRPRVVDEPERSELWQRVNDNYNGYDTYEQRARGRVIPVVLLEPSPRV